MGIVTDQLRWMDWRPLRGASRDREIPGLPGLSRIRRVGRGDLDHIGQTGRNLRARVGSLGEIYADEMPYDDPHTAGPGLLALRHAAGCDEVSILPLSGDAPWRKGIEALAIALYRQESGRSPTVKFGRMPAGCRGSSGNNSRLSAAGKRFRGGPAAAPDASHAPGVQPAGPPSGHTHGDGWAGHRWSGWTALEARSLAGTTPGSGLYRIRGYDPALLIHVGQGRVPDRPLAHLAKGGREDHPQGAVLRRQDRLEVSWTIDDGWMPHQRLELENDLIAAHLLETGRAPEMQFLG